MTIADITYLKIEYENRVICTYFLIGILQRI